MLLEAFVISICAGGFECNQVTQAYYLQNKELQEFVQVNTEKAKQIAGPFITEDFIPIVGPMLILGTGKSATVVIDKHWSIKGNAKDGMIMVGWTY